VAGVTFSDSTFHQNPDPGWVQNFFKVENLTPVQTLDTIDPTEIYPCLCISNDHTDSCYRGRSLASARPTESTFAGSHSVACAEFMERGIQS